jgi:hypothetical protein
VKRRQFERVLSLPEEASTAVMSVEEGIAWAAGLFDGEGSVYLAKHRTHVGYFRLEAAITQSDPTGQPEVLTRFRAVTDLGFVKGPYPAPEGCDPVYRWKLYRREEIERLIDRLRPHLGSVKRAQAERAIAVVAAQVPLPRGNPAWGNNKTHCVNGHEYASGRIRAFRGRGKNREAPRVNHHCLRCAREAARDRRRSAAKSKKRTSRGRASGSKT